MKCDCLNDCGDDPRIQSGKVIPCERYACNRKPTMSKDDIRDYKVPEGWTLIPNNPPDLLLNSFLEGYGARGGSFNAMHLRDRARRGYQRMLQAVPAGWERGVFDEIAVSAPLATTTHAGQWTATEQDALRTLPRVGAGKEEGGAA